MNGSCAAAFIIHLNTSSLTQTILVNDIKITISTEMEKEQIKIKTKKAIMTTTKITCKKKPAHLYTCSTTNLKREKKNERKTKYKFCYRWLVWLVQNKINNQNVLIS